MNRMLAMLALVGMYLMAAGGMTAASAQIVAIGASNTEGFGVGKAKAFPAQLQALLRAGGQAVTVRNAGIYGDTTKGMLARIDKAMPKGTTTLIVQFGGNDARKGISPMERQANIDAIMTKARERSIKVVEADGYVSSALRAGMKQADGIHLTVEGHQQVAEQLARAF